MRAVLYVDPPAFCTAVEGLVAPALRHRPVAVAPPGADRAVILALSLEARAAGVSRGMAVRLARRVCPDLVLLSPNPRLYARASRALDDVLRRYAPVIEPRGYGHAFLDISGTGRLFGSPVDVAARIRREARERTGLDLTVGAATNKLVSEAATRTYRQETPLPGDFPPLAVARGDEAGFLAPHPLPVLPDVSDSLRRRLDDYQLELIGEVAALRESDLVAVFGREGQILRARARGIDPRPVLTPEVRHEFRAGHTLATDTNDWGVLSPLLRRLTEQIGRRLRHRGLAARRLRVEVEFSDYAIDGRAVSLLPGALDADLWDAARRALVAALARRVGARVVTLTADRLIESDVQFDLWDAAGSIDAEPVIPPANMRIQAALDRIATRWGPRAGRRGAGLVTVPG